MPMHIRIIRGGVGKEFVVKHYGRRRVMTRFPDMSKVIASKGQRDCRNLFKEAVTFAKAVIADGDKKLKWQQRLKIRRDQVFNRVIQLYMKTAKEGMKMEAELRSETVNADGSMSIKVLTFWVTITVRQYGKLVEMDVGRTAAVALRRKMIW